MTDHKWGLVGFVIDIVGAPVFLGLAGWIIAGDKVGRRSIIGGVLLGIFAAYTAAAIGAGPLVNALAATVGVFSGPGIVMALSGHDVGIAIAKAVLRRSGVDLPEEPKGDGDQP